jgi:hypothetical protein
LLAFGDRVGHWALRWDSKRNHPVSEYSTS